MMIGNSQRQGIGRRGEELAARYLAQSGFTVLERNVRFKAGEIDLVAQDGDELVIVEVKTRIGDDSTAPDEAVSAAKLARLDRLSEAYMARRGTPDAPWRVDVIGVVLGRNGRVIRLDHLRGAYL